LPPKRSRLRTQKFEQPVAWEVVELSDEDDDKVEVDNQLNLGSPAPATPAVRSTHPGIPGSEGSFVPGREISSDVNPQLATCGTDVPVCKAKFKTFLETFVDPDIDEDENFDGVSPQEPLYLSKDGTGEQSGAALPEHQCWAYQVV
jgi:hypothetical protein